MSFGVSGAGICTHTPERIAAGLLLNMQSVAGKEKSFAPYQERKYDGNRKSLGALVSSRIRKDLRSFLNSLDCTF